MVGAASISALDEAYVRNRLTMTIVLRYNSITHEVSLVNNQVVLLPLNLVIADLNSILAITTDIKELRDGTSVLPGRITFLFRVFFIFIPLVLLFWRFVNICEDFYNIFGF